MKTEPMVEAQLNPDPQQVITALVDMAENLFAISVPFQSDGDAVWRAMVKEYQEIMKLARSELGKVNELTPDNIATAVIQAFRAEFLNLSCSFDCGWHEKAGDRDPSLVMQEHIRICVKHPMRELEIQLESIGNTLDVTPGAIRVREGGGPEDVAASVAMTLSKFQRP